MNKEAFYNIDYDAMLKNIHHQLKIDHGSFADEYPEQLMSVRFLQGHEKVLEIGGNIGRNSLIIAYILDKQNNNNFVSLESNSDDAIKLEHNRDINNLHFHVENAALSERRLVQNAWNTKPSDVDIPGWEVINTIKWQELQNKYKIDFDTLVLDCEGAFYYILYDTPEILDNIKLIIMENDYNDMSQKEYVINTLRQKNFNMIYEAALKDVEDKKDFYQVWKRN